MTRRALDAARARYRRQRFARFVGSLGFQSEVSAQPDAAYHAGVESERLLALLSPLQRTVFVLHDVEGYTHEEIGATLGIETGTSKAQLSRARAKLRDSLADFAGEWVS